MPSAKTRAGIFMRVSSSDQTVVSTSFGEGGGWPRAADHLDYSEQVSARSGIVPNSIAN